MRFQLAVRNARTDPAVDSGRLEHRLAQARGFVELRTSVFRNKGRTDALLMLMALHFNHQDDVRRYARIIQGFLRRSQGNAPVRRQVVGGPQLRT